MGRMFEPVYIMMKKKTPVENARGSWGLSCRARNSMLASNIQLGSNKIMYTKVQSKCTAQQHYDEQYK